MVSNSFIYMCVNGIAYVIILIKLIINKAGESRLTMGARGFTGVPRFTVNEEGLIKNIININLASLDS
jgi:hypothetical protein